MKIIECILISLLPLLQGHRYLRAQQGVQSSVCKTITGSACKFPFTYNGKKYNNCAAIGSQSFCQTVYQDAWGECDTSTCFTSHKTNSYQPTYSYQPSYSSSSSCTTVSGPDAYQPCVFPFKYQGLEYSSCGEWVWGGGNNGKLWCSTKTDYNNNHINGQGYYGFCPSTCAANTRRYW